MRGFERLENRVYLSANEPGELLVGFYQDLILRFDAESGASTGSHTTAGYLQRLALGPDGLLYVSHDGVGGFAGNGWIDRMDPETGTPLGTFISGLHGPYDMVWKDDELLVANRGSNDVLRFDATTGQFLGELISNPGSYTLAAFGRGPDGILYAGYDDTDDIRRYDGAGNLLGVFASGGGLDGPNDLEFGPDGDLYVASGRNHMILRYDGTTGQFLNALPSGPLSSPVSIAFGYDGNLYVSNHEPVAESRVTKLDGQTGAFIEDFVPAGFAGVRNASGLLFYPPVSAAVGVNLVVPNALQTVEGNEASEFLTGDPRAASIRYQQVFSASQFNESGMITEIAFRPDATRGTAFSGTLTNVRISLSTTSRSPDGLGVTFADNLGIDETVVFTGDLTLSSADVPGPGSTQAFDIVVCLSTPFSYDPSQGNLLLDFQRDSSSLHPLGVSFDAHDVVGDSVSRAIGSRASAIAEFSVDSAGVVTQFTLVPQPANVVAVDDAYEVDEDRTLTVAAADGVLINDSGPSDGTLTALLITGASNGVVNLNADGSFTYTPAHDFFGIDSFTYTASDGQNSNEATVTITVNSVLDARIDVKPGSDQNSNNLNSNGVIAVAILTTGDFDATAVNAASVEFAGALASHWSFEDVDGDGDTDLVVHFRTQDTNLRTIYEQLISDDLNEDGVLDSSHQSASVSLTGMTVTDELFDGVDELDLFLAGRALRDLLNTLADEGAI